MYTYLIFSMIFKAKRYHNYWIKNWDSCLSDRREWVKNAFFLRHFSAVRIFMGSKYSFWMFYHGPNEIHFSSFRTLKRKFKKMKVWNSICTYTSRVSNIESDNSQNVGLEDYNNIFDRIFPYFTTPSIKITLG